MLPIKKLQEKQALNLGKFDGEKFEKFVKEHDIEKGNTVIPYVFPRWMIRKHLQEMTLAQDIVFYAARTELKQMDYKADEYGCSKIWDHMVVFVGADKREYVVFNPKVTEEAAAKLVEDISKSDYMKVANEYVDIKVYDGGEGFWVGGTRNIVFECHEK